MYLFSSLKCTPYVRMYICMQLLHVVHDIHQISTQPHTTSYLDLRSEFSPHLLNNNPLIPNKVNTLLLNSLLRPALEPRNSLKQTKQLSTNKAILRLGKSQKPQQERSRLHLGKGDLLTATKERTLALFKKRLDFLGDGGNQQLGCLVALGFIGSFEAAVEVRQSF
jgi:hypothetical protein